MVERMSEYIFSKIRKIKLNNNNTSNGKVLYNIYTIYRLEQGKGNNHDTKYIVFVHCFF